MGMYTEFHFNSRLKGDVPAEVIEMLKFMLGEDLLSPKLPAHPLFSTDRWKRMLLSGSCYFDTLFGSRLKRDEFSPYWVISVRCNLKNYCGEIEKFVDWISPYLDKTKGKFLGFYRYETNEMPTLIFQGRMFTPTLAE